MKTAKIRVRFNGTRFYVECNFEGRSSVKRAGFLWDKEAEEWYTFDPRVAARLREHASSETESALQKVLLRISPWTGPIPFPQELTPLPFQLPAAHFSLSRNHSYQYVAPGMGKTIIASLVMNALHFQNHGHRFVYVCPAFLVKNVETELETWGIGLEAEHFDQPRLFGNVLILPSSLLHREELRGEIEHFFSTSFFPSNALAPDVLQKENTLIVDEAHQFKNDEAERTRVMFGFKDRPALTDMFSRTILMSGTAMENRPLELYAPLSKLAPETIDFMGREQFGMRYCAGRFDGRGYDYSGASNLRELGAKVKGVYMNRLKKSELKLPPLIEEIFVVADNLPGELRDFEAALMKEFTAEDLMKGRIEATFRYRDIPLPTYQRFLGLYKVKHALAWMEHVQENSDDAAIVFVRHKDVFAKIMEGASRLFKKGDAPFFIGPDTAPEERVKIAREFQPNNTRRRFMVAMLRRAGIGLNMPRATRILHVEPDWNPSVNQQGTDRAHRYGQENTVFSETMVYKNSVDHQVVKALLRKRKLGTYI